MQANVVTIDQFGGPEAMKLSTVDVAEPGSGQIQVRSTAIGVNFADLHQRRGLGRQIPLPSALGHEGAGVIERVGVGVENLAAGDRVAYMSAGIGAYATLRNVAAQKVVGIPDGIADEDVAAIIFKGLTAQYLLRYTYKVGPESRVVVHAAAGGVGMILSQWCTALGAEVYGTVGDPGKFASATGAGCKAVVSHEDPNWGDNLLAAMDGLKAHAVYDSVGQTTFVRSLDLVRPFGIAVVYGAASGPAPAIEPELLNAKGCLFLTRPSVFLHNATPDRLQANAADVFAAFAAGHFKSNIGQRFPLGEAARAHAAIEQRRSVGATVLVP